MDKLSGEILKQLLPAEPEVEAPLEPTEIRSLDHWSSPVLLERAAYLRKLAKLSNGSASETLKGYPQHSVMLSVRLRSGEAELHQDFADLFIVLEGRAKLVTGGTIVDSRSVGPGEVRGSSVQGGTEQELRPGDMAHVAAGTPHQMILPGDKTLTCVVLKIQENR